MQENNNFSAHQILLSSFSNLLFCFICFLIAQQLNGKDFSMKKIKHFKVFALKAIYEFSLYKIAIHIQ